MAIRLAHRRSAYLRFLDGRACDKAEPASDFVLADERPSRNASEASRATRREVCLLFFATWITSFCASRTFMHLNDRFRLFNDVFEYYGDARSSPNARSRRHF